MNTYKLVANGFTADVAGAYVCVTEGEIQKGDVIVATSQLSNVVSEVKSVSKYYVKTEYLSFRKKLYNGEASLKEHSALHIGAWVFRKIS